MATATLAYRPRSIWRFSRRDGLLVWLAVLHGAALVLLPVAPLIAIGVWWNSNTIAHNFIHRPFFRSAWANAIFSAALSVLLGIPQTLWRERHLAHHAGVKWRLRVSTPLMMETALVMAWWMVLAWSHPRFFLAAYLPGYLAGLGLCWAQGYWEHAAGQPTSHYGWLYNFLCFNDGFHAEHHADPSRHWTGLAESREAGAAVSHWRALLRWMDVSPLEGLERLVLRSARLQRFVLASHRQALRALLPRAGPVRSVAIVGGGLYPRSALLLYELLPDARLTVIDTNHRNLQVARRACFSLPSVEFRQELYSPGAPNDFDLTVIPLCLEGDREAIYRNPPSRAVLVHDWIWRRRGTGAVVSLLLLKRINLVRQ